MRELERRAAESTTAGSGPALPGGAAARAERSRAAGTADRAPASIAIIGRGRLGGALAAALGAAGVEVHGPLGRGEPIATGPAATVDAVLLCVPDAEIERAAAIAAGHAPLVGHTSGAISLAALAPAAAAGAQTFGLHPLQTITGSEHDPSERLAGAGCAVAGSTPAALAAARGLAAQLGMVAIEIGDRDRAAYHAAAAVASNHLIALLDAAETLAGGAGIARPDARRALAPLIRATVDNWEHLGPEQALTGPVVRGDEDTIAAHLAAVKRGAPRLVPLFEALLERTREVAARRTGERDALAVGARP